MSCATIAFEYMKERGKIMSINKRATLTVFVFMLTVIALSACTQSLSEAPAATPTLLPAGLFVSPFPSAENPMAKIEEFAKQTSVAQTVAAGGGTTGTPGTPAANVTPGTPSTITTGTVITPQVDPNVTVTPNTGTTPVTPTNSGAITPASVATTPAAPSTPATSIPPGSRPSTYTLQSGEHPFCIGRRFNVDPYQILSLSGLSPSQADSLAAGTVLTIPQSGAFPGDRALQAHPTTYSVLAADESIYSVACKFGDVDPAALASLNGLSVSSKLTPGQQLKVP
jgi:hypothetical protein